MENELITESIIEISAVKQISSGFTENPVMEISLTNGSVFFIRTCYLVNIGFENLCAGQKFDSETAEELLQAGFAYSAERKAADYLARCEQCRFGLENKLIQKGFEKKSVNLALDYLESKNFLSDERFARIWLKNHIIGKSQGRIRLLKELISRGISKNTADSALNEFFLEYDEYELCIRAYDKAVSQKKSGEKLLKYLMDNGFPYKMIQSVLKENNAFKR